MLLHEQRVCAQICTQLGFGCVGAFSAALPHKKLSRGCRVFVVITHDPDQVVLLPCFMMCPCLCAAVLAGGGADILGPYLALPCCCGHSITTLVCHVRVCVCGP